MPDVIAVPPGQPVPVGQTVVPQPNFTTVAKADLVTAHSAVAAVDQAVDKGKVQLDKGSADDLGEPVVHGEQGDDQLGRIAEARVEEASDAGPRVLSCMLRRLTDQPCERDERGAGEHEHLRVSHVREVLQRKRQGCQGEQRPEDAACHGVGSLAARARGGSLRLG